MSIITDGGAELGLGWAFQNANASRVQTSLGATISPHAGAWMFELKATGTGLSQVLGNMSQTSLAFVPGWAYVPSVWVNGDENVSGDLTIVIADETGNLGSWTLAAGSVPAGWSLWQPGHAIALGSSGSISLECQGISGIRRWYVDDVALEPLVAIRRREIRSAIITAVSGITVAGGYNTNMTSAQVHDGETMPQSIDLFPACVVEFEEEIKDLALFPRMEVTAKFAILCFAKGNTADQDADLLAADVEAALKPVPPTPFLGLAYVQTAYVTGIDAWSVDQTVARDVAMYRVEFTVTYNHTVGTP